MEEIEVPIEKLQEEIHEHAGHAQGTWIGRVALSSAILAALAAVAALLASHYSNEAMIEQIQASDSWSYYQAKSIKSSLLANHLQVLELLGKKAPAEDHQKLEKYKTDLEELTEKAQEKQAESGQHLLRHQTLAKAVTFFQVAIAIGAISVLMRRRRYWYLSLGFGAIGLFFFLQEILR